MRIWLITVGEPLPLDGGSARLLRSGILANLLAARGHDVVWWTSTFDHTHKRQRQPADTTIDLDEHLRIKMLHATAYKKNVSISRLVNHYKLGRKFAKSASGERRPDIILSSLPTLELCVAATEYGKQNNVPVVLDIRDLWPDVFLDLVPDWTRGAARWLLAPLFRFAGRACADATAILGITAAFVEWGLRYAGRPKSDRDRDFPFGYTRAAPGQDAIQKAEAFWAEHGVHRDARRFIACFVGTIGHQFDLESIIEAAERLSTQSRPIQFILGGTGEKLDSLKHRARQSKHVLFPGWLGAADIWTLMRMSAVGLAPYRRCDNFAANIPNKPIEYLSAGLPIITTIQEGDLSDLIGRHDCGLSYGIGRPDDLAAVLIGLYDRPDRRKKMAENAYSLYEQRFVAEKIYGEMIKHLEQIAATQHNGRLRSVINEHTEVAAQL